MLTHFRNGLVLATTMSAFVLLSGDAFAQCSGGGRGGGSPGQTGTTLASPSSTLASLAYQRQLAYQQQQALVMQSQYRAQQQQLYAARQRQLQQSAEEQYQQQQDLQALRLANAEEKRAKRESRIAALRAKRDSKRYENEGQSMIASTGSQSTLVSLNSTSKLTTESLD
ncbi:hypothetical protein N9N28_12875 [Rubripirellula amarantea]|uniref:Uncharacterized protein n=1 Tax=Rubripirellula amarantea TaxID=2527999 RepID=A0A5C5WU87_9BACT|nr:hypothetical protein [Rubripirellula amarantea]MDA8745519.1 hypothetical protein [Rubripirellula amarantea]TWT53691.1 hypothetical protein Pla22_13220 [Rubripirellula amarantea]